MITLKISLMINKLYGEYYNKSFFNRQYSANMRDTGILVFKFLPLHNFYFVTLLLANYDVYKTIYLLFLQFI